MCSPALAARGASPAKCWRARISVGAISTACLPASTTSAMASSATSVLPEPTSPCSSRSMLGGRGEVGADLGQRAVLGGGEREGQGGLDSVGLRVRGGVGTPGARPQAGAHEGERDLVGEKLVKGEPHAAGCLRRDRLRHRRAVHRGERLAERRRAALLPGRVPAPGRQVRQPGQRRVHRLGEHARVEAIGEAVDRLGQRHGGKALRVDDAVGVHHLAMAVVELEPARHPALGAERQHLLDPGMVGQKEDEQHVAGRILDQHAVRRLGAWRRRAMLGHAGLERHHTVASALRRWVG